MSLILSRPAITGETKYGPNLPERINQESSEAKDLPSFVKRSAHEFAECASFDLSAFIKCVEVGLKLHPGVARGVMILG